MPLIHGLIRDEQGRKMSKSLGNGIDPMDVIDKYGTDSLRWFLSNGSAPGQDVRFSYEKMDASWNFINKIWNISRYILMNNEGLTLEQATANVEKVVNKEAGNVTDRWILHNLNETSEKSLKTLISLSLVSLDTSFTTSSGMSLRTGTLS